MEPEYLIERLSPFIRFAWDGTTSVTWELAERILFDFELLYVKSGEIEVTIEGTSYYGQPGDIFYFRPGWHHSIRLIGSKPLRQPHIHFDFFHDCNSESVKISFKPLKSITPSEKKLIRKDITDDFCPGFPSHIRLNNPAAIERMILDIIAEYDSKLIHHQTLIKGMFIQLWVHLLREVSFNDIRTPSNIDQFYQIKQYIDTHVNQDLKLEDLYNMFHLSKYFICHMFSRIFGVSPIEYHRTLRIGNAKKLIQFTNMSVTEIANQLGYTNVHTFSRAFKVSEGVPPTYYRH